MVYGYRYSGWSESVALSVTESATASEKRNPAGQVRARPGQLGEHHCWNLKMTGWEDDWMGDDWMCDDWIMGDDWMAFRT